MEKADEPQTVRFEERMDALEEIVSRLESGDLALEDALKAFEEGVGLVRSLNEKLSEAERKIEILSRADNGTLRVQPFDEEETD